MKDISSQKMIEFAKLYEEVNMVKITEETKFSQMEQTLLQRYVQGKETAEKTKSLLSKCALFNNRIGMAQANRFI